ncbi:MAG TPA: transglycosylase domain-containing protein [Pseudolysinimonas sp.]|nr:transglycosylase domain-containing protein [Pseudolysinimonas sp.]
MPAQKSTVGRVLGAVIGTVAFSALAGALVTVMVAPAIAVTGITANSTIGIFDALPEYIVLNGGSQANTIVAKNADGTDFPIATIFDQNREEADLDEMSEYLMDAAIAGEDRRFWEHGGVDLTSVIRAGAGSVAGEDSGGASTLTMQTVRNILIQDVLNNDQYTPTQRKAKMQEALAKTVDRKLKEMKLAIGLEKKYTKEEILRGYLNIAGFGGNTYGVKAAARQYFSKDVADLTVAEAASLIAIVQNPSTRDLKDPKHYAANQQRRNVILFAMYQTHRITKAQYKEAYNTPVDANFIRYSAPKSGCLNATVPFNFVCAYVEASVKDFNQLGDTVDKRREAWRKGGLTVTVSINPSLQQAGTSIIQQYAPNTETRFQLGASAASVEVGTGRILVMAQNKDFNNLSSYTGTTATGVNFNSDVAHGGSVGFQPGSTYKPYVLLAFLAAGHGVNETFNASIRSVNQADFADSCGGPYTGIYKFRNDSNEQGSYDIRRATGGSVNSVFIQMAKDLDQCEIKKIAESIGVHNASGKELATNPGCAIGGCTNNIAPLTTSAAYAAIANGGVYCKPVIVDEIVDRDGKKLGPQAADCGQSLVTPEVAAGAAYAMAAVMSATASASNPGDGTPYIGKTGTTNDAIHTWMAGTSTKVSTTVWVGNVSGTQNLRKISVNRLPAAKLRHNIFKPLARAIDAQYPGSAFPKPDPSILKGTPAIVPDVSGMTPEAAKAAIDLADLTWVDGGAVDSDQPAGTVVSSSPAAGSSVSKGTNVATYTSNGQGAVIPSDLVGKMFNAAKTELEGLGFINVVEDCGSGGIGVPPPPAHQVTGSSPGAGSIANKNNPVTLHTNGVC